MSKSLAYEPRKIDIINHSVKPNNVELLSFFYPDFKTISDNVMIVDGPVIYTGDTAYLNRIKNFGHSVISVTSLGEFDLSDNRTLVDMTFSKWSQEVPARLVKFIDDLDYDELLNAVKIHWVTGKWTIRKYSKKRSFYNISRKFYD